MLTVQHAQLNHNTDGIFYSEDYGDNYYSTTSAIDECKHVFISGNKLHDRWQRNDFSIAELGFGAGLTFLNTSLEWLKQASPKTHLHFISFEKHPLTLDDLKHVHAQFECNPNLTTLADELYSQYPLPIEGFHRLHLANKQITLTLVLGDALKQLRNCDYVIDAWYLDGFSPTKNPSMWSEKIAIEVFRLTAPGGSFATYNATDNVKQHFEQAGFEIKKTAGFGDKKEMLTGIRHTTENKTHFHLKEKSWFKHTPIKAKSKQDQKAIIIGGGMAGFSIAAALAQRGWQTVILDRQIEPAQEGSGNQNAILMPRLSVDHDLQSQLTLQGFLYSEKLFKQLDLLSDQQLKTPLWHACGALQIPRDKNQSDRMQKIIQQEQVPEQLIQAVSQSQASQLADCDLSMGGWYIPDAGWLVPQQLCLTLQHQWQDQIEFIGGQNITRLQQHAQGWHVYSEDKHIISGTHVVVANASSSHCFEQTHGIQCHPKRGQLSIINTPNSSHHPKKIICSDVYLTPEVNQQYVLGASFITNDIDTTIRLNEHQSNIEKLNKIIPTFKTSISQLTGRVGIRAVSSDRLPIVGPVALQDKFAHDFQAAALGSTHLNYPQPQYYPGLYMATGFGSRGLAWIPLMAESLASNMTGEASPLSQALQEATHPNRHLMKALVKSMRK